VRSMPYNAKGARIEGRFGNIEQVFLRDDSAGLAEPAGERNDTRKPTQG